MVIVFDNIYPDMRPVCSTKHKEIIRVRFRVAPDIGPAGYPVSFAGYPARKTLHGRYILSSKPTSPLNITVKFRKVIEKMSTSSFFCDTL